MTTPVYWNEQAMPLGVGLDQLLYQVRRTDDGLLFDSVTMAELTDGEQLIALDALVTPYAKLERKVRQLQQVMARAVQGMSVEAAQVSDPFKQNGTANVVALFELSDGQTVSVYFHNPDATPGKILPTDELISWKWLLNKKDITIVVAPERGSDLAIREVGRRIMKLAAKNSAAFARVNARRADRLQNIANLRGEVEGLERELDGLTREIEVARLEAEERNLKAVEDGQQNSVEKGMAALNSVRQFLSRGQFRAIADAMKGEEGRFFIDKAKVLAQLIEGMAKTYEQDGKGDDATAYLHYFKGSGDWYITEKDASGKGTEQAFGLADLGQGGELGYISIDELVRNNVELDLHFEPKPLSAVGKAEPEPVGADDAPSEASKLFDAYLADAGGDPFQAANDYFKAELKGRLKFVNTSIGKVYLTGAGWKEMKRGMKSDDLKARLTPHIPEILSAGAYGGRSAPHKERSDGFVAFHFFEKDIDLGEVVVTAGINVGEREDGMYEYTAYGLGHSLQEAWAKRKASDSPGNEPGTEAFPGGVSAALDSTLGEGGDGINIVILKVIDKATGQRLTELEDGRSPEDERIQRLLSMLNGARDQLATMQPGTGFYGNLQRDIADMASQLWNLGYREPGAVDNEEQGQIAVGTVEHEQPAAPDLAWLEAAELFGRGVPGFAGAHATGDRAETALAGSQAGGWTFAADLKAAAFRDVDGKVHHGPSAESPAEAFKAMQGMPEWAALQASGEAAMLVPEGIANTVKTAKGTKVETGFAVVEAGQLIASHDINGNVNPDYPQLFQPRDRSRDSSIAWVKKTANQLDPDSLGRTSRADSGAPIVGPDRVVESGNGRTMALQEAYRAGTAEEYREWLIAEAEYFGLKPERVRAMKAPVLVRVRTTDIDRRVFAIEANQDDKLTMTGSEKARADADRLDMALLAQLSDDGNLLAAANRDFVNGFLRSLGDTEAAQYMTSNGQPTGALIARIQAAIFAKAYQDDRLLELTADSSRPEVANVLEALNVSAPEFILAQAADAAGTQALSGKLVDSVEASLNQQAVEAIIQATNLVRKARSEGGSVEEAINQLGLFGDIPPATAAMALFISKNNRSAKRLGVAFRAMAEFVRSEAERGQTVDMFGESEQASLQQIIEAANRKLDQEYGEGAYAIESMDLFAAPSEPEPAPEPSPAKAMNYTQWSEALVQEVQSQLSVDRGEALAVISTQKRLVDGFGNRADQAPERTPAEVAAEMIEKLTSFPVAPAGWASKRSADDQNYMLYTHVSGEVEIALWAVGVVAGPVDFYKYKIIKNGAFHSDGRVPGESTPRDAQSMESVFAQAESLVTEAEGPPDGWRSHLIKARQYADELGVPRRDKTLDQLVADIDAYLAQESEMQPEQPTPESAAQSDDRSFLESIINNTVADILAPELGDQIGAVYERNAEDAEMLSLIEQAVMAYQRAMEQATASL